MKLGFLAPGSPEDVTTYSGVPYFAFRALKRRIPSAFIVDAGDLSWSSALQRINQYSKSLTGFRLLVSDAQISRRRVFDKIYTSLEKNNADSLLTLNTDFHVPEKAGVPIVMHSDATIAAIARYYPEYRNVVRFSLKQAEKMTQSAYDRASFCAFASTWAANSAINDFHQDKQKVRVVPYGANLIVPPSRDISQIHQLKDSCQFLFIGRDWDRKGGRIAFEVMLELQKRGRDVKMTAVGCSPDVKHPDLKVLPFLNKKIQEDMAVYDSLWKDSHFLFQPSQQETFGAIYAEAAANGVPVIACRTGGVPDAVQHGVTGCLLEHTATVGDYVDVVEEFFNDPEKYASFCRNARGRYESVLNWDAWADSMAELVELAIFNWKAGK